MRNQFFSSHGNASEISSPVLAATRGLNYLVPHFFRHQQPRNAPNRRSWFPAPCSVRLIQRLNPWTMGLDKEASSSSTRLDAAPLLPQHGLHGGGPGAGGHLSSQPKTFANVFIAVVGTGVLGLPYTFSRTGWAAGTLLLLAVAALTFHCMMLLVAARRRIADEDPKISSFGDLGHAIYGAPGRHAVDAMLVLSQVSFCVGYVIFISNTMAHLYPVGADSPASPLLTA